MREPIGSLWPSPRSPERRVLMPARRTSLRPDSREHLSTDGCCALIGGASGPLEQRWRHPSCSRLRSAIDHHGLEYLGLATPRLVRWNLSPTALVQSRSFAPRACWLPKAPCARPPARTPGAARTTGSSSTSPASATPSTGARSTSRSPPRRGAALGQGAGARGGPRAVRPGPSRRRRPGAPPAGARGHRERLAQPVRPQHVPGMPARGACRFRARFHGPPAAQPEAPIRRPTAPAPTSRSCSISRRGPC